MSQEEAPTAAERAASDATLLSQFNELVRQSREMLESGGAPAERARDISYARSMLFLPAWHVVACAVQGATQPEIQRLSMIEVRDAQGQPCPSLAVFPTDSLARAEIPRMQIPIESGFWVTLAVPTEQVVAWVKSMKIPAVAVVTVTATMAPSCVLGLDFIEWVAKIEAQQQQQSQQPPQG
jgi:hypothetical protein